MSDPSDSTPAGAVAPEVRRRRREVWIILATAIAVVVLVLFQTRIPSSPGAGSLGSDALLIALIDLNLILLIVLVFLVGRHVVKLIFDRRNRIMGANLRAKLVGAFLAIALLPAALLFSTAWVFVNSSVERWFEGKVENSLAGSVEVAHAYYEDLAATNLAFARQLAARITGERLLAKDRRDDLRRVLAERRAEYQLDLVEVFVRERTIGRSRRESLPAGIGTDPGGPLVLRAAGGKEDTVIDPVGEADVIRAAVPVMVDGKPAAVVVVDGFVPQSVVKRREEIERAFADYRGLQLQRRPIKTTYSILLGAVTLVSLFSAIWFGFYLARGITVPIQKLAEGAARVGRGDLEQRIEGEGDDEMGTLVRAFNQMTGELQTSRTELDSRRRYLETLLANITAGVVSTAADGTITTMNRAAETLLGLPARRAVGTRIADAFRGEGYAEVRELVAELGAMNGVPVGDASLERQVTLGRDGQEVALLLTGTRLLDDGGMPRGMVLFFEDVSHLLRVQRMEAWREVARRIAHEIKNPLTPVALAAQRLRRRYRDRLGDDGAVFDDCTRTIIQQVEELKGLVNEFATFARMPAGAHTPQDVNLVVDEALVLFREGHRHLDFTFIPGEGLPSLELDREGVKRAIINILDNAVSALAQRRDAPPDERGRVELRTTYDAKLDVVRLEIADNGPGMAPEVKARLFEPYFSTKPDGTGLGLAIVSAIVADHHGFVRVRDNLPRGSRFIMEFPVRQRAVTLAAGGERGAYAGA